MTKAVASIEEYNRTDENKERFSDYLIRKGVLSPKMLHQLQTEFMEKSNSTSDTNTNMNNSNNGSRDRYEDNSQHKLTKRTKKRK